MLKHLHVSNYVLIDQLEVDFQQGLSIITGETGAGKSILIGALGLILGQRADTKVLQNKERKCTIEGLFDINEYELSQFFHDNDLDFDVETTIRREINPSGKSRAFINDTPVNLSLLKEFGNKLIDIHSQHETLSLNDSAYQVEVLDAYASTKELVSAYKQQYRQYKETEQALHTLQEEEQSSKTDLDYLEFLHKELSEAALVDGEQEELEGQLKALENAEKIKTALFEATQTLSGDSSGIMSQLRKVQAALNQAGAYHEAIGALGKRVESSSIELQDISDELELLQNQVEHDPDSITEMNDRLNMIYGLQQKHRVQTVGELLTIQKELQQKINNVSSLDEKVDELKNKLQEELDKANQTAEDISTRRGQAIPQLEKEVNMLMKQLGMPDARLKIEKEKQEALAANGKDLITYLFSANRGGRFMEMKKVASGGELTRLMLCIKSIVAQLATMPTVIFDEIDTGVSGEIADKVGSVMRQMAASMQVISITHLPQIAVKGNTHYLVYKEASKGGTRSVIRLIEGEERLEHIARMLSGEELTSAALDNARELLGSS